MNHCKTVGLIAWLEANTQVQYVRVINIFFMLCVVLLKAWLKWIVLMLVIFSDQFKLLIARFLILWYFIKIHFLAFV